MRRPKVPDRRSVLLGAALLTGAAGAGCSGSSRRLGDPARKLAASQTPEPTTDPAVDEALRSRTVAQERRLLTACAAPTGQEPFASVRTLHLQHLQRLGSRAVHPAARAHSPARAPLAAAELAAAASLRTDCVMASAQLAPLLASIAASAEIAAVLLSP